LKYYKEKYTLGESLWKKEDGKWHCYQLWYKSSKLARTIKCNNSTWNEWKEYKEGTLLNAPWDSEEEFEQRWTEISKEEAFIEIL